TSRDVLKEMLQAWGLKPMLTDTYASAEGKLEGRSWRIPLALIDSAMPGLGGFTLAKRMIEHGHDASHIIMMLSAGEHGFDFAQYRQIGIANCVTKPIKHSELSGAIVKALGADSCLATPEADVSQRPSSSRKILLVEDGLVNQAVALGLLRPRGHTVFVAGDG